MALTGKYLFFWIPEAQKAFESLKKNFISALILAQFDPEKETRLEADLSGYAAGGRFIIKRDKRWYLAPYGVLLKKIYPGGE